MKSGISQQIPKWLIGCATFILFASILYFIPKTDEVPLPPNQDEELIRSDYSGKILVVLVVKGAVQIGDHLLSVDKAITEIPRIIKEHQVRNLCVFASDDARWGDVVSVYSVGNIPNAKRRQLSPTAIRELTVLPEFVNIRKDNRIWCGFSIGLDSYVHLDMYDRESQ